MGLRLERSIAHAKRLFLELGALPLHVAADLMEQGVDVETLEAKWREERDEA
jgi:hypothetical protein